MSLLPNAITAIQQTIKNHEAEITELDKAIGDGDHVINLQRGLAALAAINEELSKLSWPMALQKVGMTLMSTMGGASGSLFGTLFVKMAKASSAEMNLATFSDAFSAGVESVQQRGKAELGEKTMLDTLIPVANSLQLSANSKLSMTEALQAVKQVAIAGMESTKELQATKGRASFLGERAIGHIDPGARTSQLMICAIADLLLTKQ
ncbi:dihydroxyacetone kinase subunit L [Methylophaga sp. 41_12_T18]|nr:dihydroxyacetone kinase subunit L [Methylophaga sp. 41_12_T18]